MEQDQIKLEKNKKEENEDEELDMKGFVKDIKSMQNRMNYATNHVHEQDKRLVGINEKLDKYNKNVKTGEQYTDVVNKGVFGYLKDKLFGIFSRDDKKLSKNDSKIIEKAKNQPIEDNKNNEYNNIEDRKDNGSNVINQKKDDDDDDIDLDEALKEVKQLRKCVKEFSSAVKDSTQLVEATDKNMDISLNNVNKANKKLKKAK